MQSKRMRKNGCRKMLKNVLTAESSCGIEPQSLTNENVTIRLWLKQFLVLKVVTVILIVKIRINSGHLAFSLI